MEGAYDAHYREVAVDGEVAIATGTSTYFVEPGGPIDRVYDNCFVMRFGADGRCRQFADYYSLRETELLVLELRVVDLTEGEIAERVGISQAEVSRILKAHTLEGDGLNGVAEQSRRDLDRRQSESLRFICACVSVDETGRWVYMSDGSLNVGWGPPLGRPAPHFGIRSRLVSPRSPRARLTMSTSGECEDGGH